MKTIDLVERIEGEAKLSCSWKDGIVNNASIDFLNFRGFEYILKGKSPLDALVYTPRICGICGQAHLKASVEALEDIYKNLNEPLSLTPKSLLLREIGLNIEIIDSHIKWFYMFIMPDIVKLQNSDLGIYTPLKGSRWQEASKTASETIKGLALIGGQWPHTSYMIPGGVMSDPTLLELTSIQNYMDYAIRFFENSISGVNFDRYLSFSNTKDLDLLKGDLEYFKNIAMANSLQKLGCSHNRFISLASSSLFNKGIIRQRTAHKIDLGKIKESSEHTFSLNKEENNSSKTTWSKSASYDNSSFETGPLARALISNEPNRRFIKDLHKQYNDSAMVRVLARMDELAHLLQSTKNLISKVDISEESFIKPKYSLKDIDKAHGKSVVEACRGSLYHDITIECGKIKNYDVITPTVWNLGPKNKDENGVAQEAIIGSASIEIAKIILRSFDVCSVCTTH